MGNMLQSSAPAPQRPRLICLEGNIAAGKSDCLAALEKEGYTVFTEPIGTEWAHFFNLLSEDPKRWTFAFQVKVLCTLEEQKEKARSMEGPVKDNVIFFERSTKACLAFSKLAHAKGNLTDAELNLITDLCCKYDSGADDYIFLNCPDPACFERMQKRNRPQELRFVLSDLADIRQAMEREQLDKKPVDASKTVDMSVANILLEVLCPNT